MEDKPGKILALFDFDGTITRKDTLFEMMKFLHGERNFYLGIMILSPYLFLYLIKILPNWKVKEKLFTYFLGGMPSAEFEIRCEQFTQQVLPPLIREKALSEIKALKAGDAAIVVVTASAENWVAPWCKQLNIGCIGTRLEVKRGRLTGRIGGQNCNGEEKVNRIKTSIDLSSYSKILAYGDTKNDVPMLKLSTHTYYRPFHG